MIKVVDIDNISELSSIIKGELNTKASVTAFNSLSNIVDNKVDKETGKDLSTNDFTDDLKTKLEGIDMSTKVDKVEGKDLSTNDFTDDLKTKLEGIDMSTKVDKVEGKGLSTNDLTDDLVSKINEIDDKVDKVEGKDLSTNDFTDALKTKLEGIDISTKLDKVTTATSGNIPEFNSDGEIEDSGVSSDSIVTSDLLSSQVTATNQALSKSEIHELIQRNAAAVICANENMSAGFQIQSHQFHTLFTTLTCLEDGPWYKMHNGSVVQCGSDSEVYVETNDIATVIADETLFYFYIHNIKYQRVKLGDATKPWGAITNADGENIDLQVDYTTLGEPVVWILDTSTKHKAIHEGHESILLGRVASIPSKTGVIEEYVGYTSLADVVGKTPDATYDLDFPSSVYYCVAEQTSTSSPTWALSYSINNMAFTNEQFAAINSGATEAKISQIATNTAAISGKQDSLTTAQLTAVNSGITPTLVTQIGTNTTAISGKQDSLTTDQLSAVNSGITSTLVTQIGTNTTAISGKQDKFNYVTESTDGLAITEDTAITASIIDIKLGADSTTSTKELTISNDADDETITNIDIKPTGTTNNVTNLNIVNSSLNTTNSSLNINVGGSTVATVIMPPPISGQPLKLTINSEFTYFKGTLVDFGTSYITGGFKGYTPSSSPTPDVYWCPTSSAAPSAIVFDDSTYVSTTLSYTFQGCFTASNNSNLQSSTKGGIAITWYGDYGIEAGEFYEFSVRKVSSTKCIGIITKLEQ